MLTMVCVHYRCPQCGDQKHCLDSKLISDDPLICSSGHEYFVTDKERETINGTFDIATGPEFDLYL